VLTTLRAALALVLLAGFYVFAAGLIAGMVLLGATLHSPKLFLFALIAAGGLLVAFWKVLRTKPELPSGFRVDERRRRSCGRRCAIWRSGWAPGRLTRSNWSPRSTQPSWKTPAGSASWVVAVFFCWVPRWCRSSPSTSSDRCWRTSSGTTRAATLASAR
jgi:hypothetical protein